MSISLDLRAQWRPRVDADRAIDPPVPSSLVMHPWLREAGVPVNSFTASQVAAVYGCCRIIVDCLAPATIKATELKANGIREDRDDDPVAWVLNYGARVDLAADALPAQAIEEALFWSALLLGDGNGYAEIQRDGAGRLFALWPIDPDWVTPRYDSRGRFYYEVRARDEIARIEAVDMFHLRGPALTGWVGDATVYRAAKAIGTAHAQQVYRAAYFANGTVISGLLTSDKSITQEQANRAKEKWVEEHGGGPGSAHGLSVLGQGLKYQPINHSAQESMLVEAARFQVQEIARFFGVPTTLLADNEAWTNLSELYRGFYTHTLRGWAERFDAEATRKLYPQRQPWREVHHDLTHLTLGSFKDQVSALRDAVNGGLWTRNEARAVFGKNSVPDGDEIVVDGTIKSLEDALDPPEPPAPQNPNPPEADPAPKPEPMEMERPSSFTITLPVAAAPAVDSGPLVRGGIALALANHRRRWVARSKDVAEDRLASARAELRAKFTTDLGVFAGHATDAQFTDLATQVEAGVEPEKAIDAVLGGRP